jgi:large subunit ribosomal protein L19
MVDESVENQEPEAAAAPAATASAPNGRPVKINKGEIIRGLAEPQFKQNLPDFGPGDTVRVAVRVVEGANERIQNYEGVVIRRQGRGISETFLVRRIASHGIGVERNFLVHSPRLDSITVLRRAKVHRAALYFLRGRTGRAARLKERRV